ncbi:MAG: FAD-dependent oxidoreductase [Candidatus Methanofastidiosa archaeon]|nr:FAD-dependent oxidoreductase [Candidatus Methanofastidiosa archaeon]
MPKHLLIIGAGAAGLPVASHVRRKDKDIEITVITDREYFAYSPCGIPFVLSGNIPSFDSLILRNENYYKEMGINVITKTKVKKIEIDDNSVSYDNKKIKYDILVIATGAKPIAPPIPGINLKGVYFLNSLEDAFNIRDALSSAKNPTIIGAGAIGLEMAHAFLKKGLKVRVIEMKDHVLPNILDKDMGDIVYEYLSSLNMEIHTSTTASAIIGKEKVTHLKANGNEYETDLVLVSVGVKPNVDLAIDAGIEIGSTGGIVTDASLRVKRKGKSVNNVYACGNCVEVTDIITHKSTISALGSTAIRQGIVVADNIMGKNSVFGSISSPSIAVVGELEIGSVGVTKEKAIEYGIVPLEGKAKGLTRARYYPRGEDIYVKILSDSDYRVIGTQVISKEGVKGRIDAMSLLIGRKTTVHQVAISETSYAPPISSVLDPLIMAARKIIGAD